jgi:hypothetical protein
VEVELNFCASKYLKIDDYESLVIKNVVNPFETKIFCVCSVEEEGFLSYKF